MGQNVLSPDLVVEHVEAVSRLILRLAIQLDLKFPYLTRRCQTHRQSPFLPSFPSTPRSMGPSLRRHYPTSQVIWPTPTPSLTAALSSDVRSRDPRQTRASPTRRRITFFYMPCSIPRWTGSGARWLASCAFPRGFLPCPCCLPLFRGGSASTSLLSRPAQASHALRPAELLTYHS